MREPKTLAEKLDATNTGEQFAHVLECYFQYLEAERDEDDE